MRYVVSARIGSGRGTPSAPCRAARARSDLGEVRSGGPVARYQAEKQPFSSARELRRPAATRERNIAGAGAAGSRRCRGRPRSSTPRSSRAHDRGLFWSLRAPPSRVAPPPRRTASQAPAFAENTRPRVFRPVDTVTKAHDALPARASSTHCAASPELLTSSSIGLT
jgi:hypothetical protein